MPNSQSLAALLDPACGRLIADAPRVAVAVSGGADSLALLSLIADGFPGKPVFAYTIDHGLRRESANEAAHVASLCARWPHVRHRILRWDGPKPDTGIQDAARAARYDLLCAACRADDVPLLCLAHHRDDQAETVLHRMAKGSGLDGLAGMRAVSARGDITLLRPLLAQTHAALCDHCRMAGLDWVEDPSNGDPAYARIRLRRARDVLDAEGLSNDRLSRLAGRMARARDALDRYADLEWEAFLNQTGQGRITLAPGALALPPEIVLRLILKAAQALGRDEALRAAMKRLEDHLDSGSPSRLSLAGLLITLDAAKGIVIERETLQQAR